MFWRAVGDANDTTVAVDLQTAPAGTPHAHARCCWCASALVVAQVENLKCWLCPIDYRRQLAHLIRVKAQDAKHAKLLGVAKGGSAVLNVPLPSQVLIYEATAKNVLWGGHAGPGKSHGVRWYLYERSLNTPKHEGLLLRENWEQLEKTHIRRMMREVPLLGGEFSNRTALFPDGAVIDCGHMADFDAVQRYLSTNYGAIVPEEASVYPTDTEGTTPLAELSTRAREVYRDREGRTVDPRFVPVTNPGGPSSPWLTQMFVDHEPDLEKFPKLRPVFDETGVQIKGYRAEQWVYIPAKLADNPYMVDDYEDTDLAVLTGVRYRQLAEGDWHVFAGQFFQKWMPSRHVRDLGDVRHCQWFRSLDWGHNAPGCVLWWAILPDHHLYLRAELKFQQMDEPEVAEAIQKIDKELGIQKVMYTAADPAVFNKTGATHRAASGFVGQSIGQTLGYYGIGLTGADNDRINGWKRVHSLLRDAPDGQPWLAVHPSCTYLIRSMSSAKSDEKNPDDVDTKSDDHALDAIRYGAMSRPSPALFKPRLVIPAGSPADIMRRMRATESRKWGEVA